MTQALLGVQLSDKLSFFSPKGVKLPVAVSAFPDELGTVRASALSWYATADVH